MTIITIVVYKYGVFELSSIIPIIKLTPYEQNKYEEKKKQEENYDDIDEEKLWKEVEEEIGRAHV